jgi:signal transduction histidine kinase
MAAHPANHPKATSIRTLVTHFAPAERVPIEIVHRQAGPFQPPALAAELLNSVLNYVLVLNGQRQIVFASSNTLDLVPGSAMEDFVGRRPGEALGCIHAGECEGGCGTSESCSQCGAVNAILASLAGRRDLQECRMTRLINCQQQSLDLLVLARPLHHESGLFSVVSFADVSHEKRRQALERVFFHDLVNLAGGAEMLLEGAVGHAPDELRGDLELSREAVHEMLDEIEAQRDLSAAERDELLVRPREIRLGAFLAKTLALAGRHPVADKKIIKLLAQGPEIVIQTDPHLLQRVVINLVKNAAEASEPGDEVTVACEQTGDAALVSVHNRAAMPREVQLQVFNRSFSTKGPGRGLGTYSVRLLTEKYLRGQVSFSSAADRGTTFTIALPL